MLNLSLTDEEQKLLMRLLDNCIDDLHSEIIRTENLDFKNDLKRQKEVLLKLRNSLKISQTDSIEVG